MTEESGGRRRYALCGLSSRGLRLFGVPLLGASGPNDTGVDLSAHGELVAIVDVDPERVARFNGQLSGPIPCYLPGEFERMIVETSPDVVLSLVARRARSELGVLVAAMMWAKLARDVCAAEASGPAYGHACELETSLAMVLAPELVRSIGSVRRPSGRKWIHCPRRVGISISRSGSTSSLRTGWTAIRPRPVENWVSASWPSRWTGGHLRPPIRSRWNRRITRH